MSRRKTVRKNGDTKSERVSDATITIYLLASGTACQYVYTSYQNNDVILWYGMLFYFIIFTYFIIRLYRIRGSLITPICLACRESCKDAIFCFLLSFFLLFAGSGTFYIYIIFFPLIERVIYFLLVKMFKTEIIVFKRRAYLWGANKKGGRSSQITNLLKPKFRIGWYSTVQ